MKKIATLLFCLFCYSVTYASHNRAGEITYKFVSGYTYEITVTTYTKESSTLADKCQLTVKFGDSQSADFNRVNGPKSPALCNGTVPIGETLGGGVKKNLYVGKHTFPGPGSYKITMEDPNRNSKICNFGGAPSDQLSFYLISELKIDSNLPPNNAVVLSNPPVQTGCVDNCFTHDVGATDPDGDSLAFKLVPCYANGAPIMTFELPNNMTIDNKGKLEWCSTPTICSYNIAILIEEWKHVAGGPKVFIGSVIRDMQIDILSSCNVGINELRDDKLITIAPNPTNGTFTLSSTMEQDTKATLFITNMLGQLVQETQLPAINKGTTVQTNLEEGVYIIKVATEKQVSVQRLVVKK
jgi:hypothetical protein